MSGDQGSTKAQVDDKAADIYKKVRDGLLTTEQAGKALLNVVCEYLFIFEDKAALSTLESIPADYFNNYIELQVIEDPSFFEVTRFIAEWLVVSNLVCIQEPEEVKEIKNDKVKPTQKEASA